MAGPTGEWIVEFPAIWKRNAYILGIYVQTPTYWNLNQGGALIGIIDRTVRVATKRGGDNVVVGTELALRCTFVKRSRSEPKRIRSAN